MLKLINNRDIIIEEEYCVNPSMTLTYSKESRIGVVRFTLTQPIVEDDPICTTIFYTFI